MTQISELAYETGVVRSPGAREGWEIVKLALVVAMVAGMVGRLGWDEYRLHKQEAELTIYNSVFKELAQGYNEEIREHNSMFHAWEKCEQRSGGLPIPKELQ